MHIKCLNLFFIDVLRQFALLKFRFVVGTVLVVDPAVKQRIGASHGAITVKQRIGASHGAIIFQKSLTYIFGDISNRRYCALRNSSSLHVMLHH